MWLVVLFFWRIALFVISALTSRLYPFTPRFPYSDIYLIPSGLPAFIWRWANFDGVHYLTIAHRAYFAQFTQAFFPFYPLLMRITAFIIHDETNIISGLLISFVGLCAAYLVFKKLLLLDYSQPEVSKILIFLLFFPTSFYFAALYTESLFMLLVFAALYSARKRHWYLAAICAGLASATRITGIFLLPALLWEWLHVSIQTHKSSKINLLFLTKAMGRSPVLYIAPLGLILYMLYLQWQFKDALYFWHAQPAFGAARSLGIIFPPQVVWRYLKILSSITPTQSEYWVALFEIVCYFFAVIALYIAYRKKVRISYQLFSWGVVLVPPLTGTFTSIPRYILTAFPLMIVLGTIKNKFMQTAIMLLSAFLFMLLASYFIRGLWVS